MVRYSLTRNFFRKFRLNGNFLQYMQVVSAIPKDLIKDARRHHIDKSSILSKSSFQLSADLSLDLLKMKNRNYYWLLISKDQQEINANMKWERDFLPEKILARHHFSRVKYICRDNKLREFYFELLHRIVVAKRELFTYGIAENALCPY